MKKTVILVLAMVVGLFAVSLAYAEDDMDKDEACKLLGRCGKDMVDVATSMLNECNDMMKQAEVLMDKGKKIRGQGLRWRDKELEDEGMALYDEGKSMYDKAKAMSETCKLIIEKGEKTKKKYASSDPAPGDAGPPNPTGDIR